MRHSPEFPLSFPDGGSRVAWLLKENGPQVAHLSITNWHLPSTSKEIKSCAAAVADFQYPLSSGWREEMRHSVLEEKLARQVFKLDILRN